jgi:hypothetical protein
MELAKQVASLELCKKLKDLGATQVLKNGDWALVDDKLHLAHNDNDTSWFLGNDYSTFFPFENEDTTSPYYNEPSDYCKAFTVAELGEMLPTYIFTLKNVKGWYAGDYKKDDYLKNSYYGNEFSDFYAETEADARAKMLIYLLENKLITL